MLTLMYIFLKQKYMDTVSIFYAELVTKYEDIKQSFNDFCISESTKMDALWIKKWRKEPGPNGRVTIR